MGIALGILAFAGQGTKGIQLQISRSQQEVERSVRACREDILALDAAARASNDLAHRERLLEQSIRHSTCLRELERSVASFHGVRAVGSPVLAWVRALWRQLRSRLGRTQARDAAVVGLTG